MSYALSALFFSLILVSSGSILPLTFGQNTSMIPSPLKQFKSGFALKDIICKSGLELVFRAQNGLPLCVTPVTLSKLLDRRMITNMIEPNLAIYPPVVAYVEKYSISNVQYVTVDIDTVAKYLGLREAIESANLVYEHNLKTCREIGCGNLSMAIPPGYNPPTHFQLPADVARKMVNDPMLNFHSLPVRGTDLIYYETNIKVENSVYHIYLDLLNI